MAVAATMSQEDNNNSHSHSNSNNDATTTNKDDEHDHEHDMVMPGFRFNPTEEELVEFYLRRKVEGKRFNVDLITFLDLYRYDPWELPALAAMGEKEWFFYVPRDRKYRNGDRPNRVTTSGYWKATGADRMIRGESSRSIGLKKTLVFYSGKAPKGIRTSWIMNEYRLPHHETERYGKAEISLCRVYKRSGVDDHPSLPRSHLTRASSSSSSDKKHQHHHHHNVTMSDPSLPHLQTQNSIESRFQAFAGGATSNSPPNNDQTDGSSSLDVTTRLGLSQHNNPSHNNNAYYPILPLTPVPPDLGHQLMEEEHHHGITATSFQHQHQNVPSSSSKHVPSSGGCSLVVPNIFASSSSTSAVDDLHRLVYYQQQQQTLASMSPLHQQQQLQQQLQYYPPHHQYSQFQALSLPPQTGSSSSLSTSLQHLTFNKLPSSLPAAFLDKMWDWNPIVPDANRDYNHGDHNNN